MMPIDEHTKLFVISVAAELAGMHPQTLRQYDRLGLVVPSRTAGRSRRYSMRDVRQLRDIQTLSHAGISLEGIRRILELDNENEALRQRVYDLERELAEARGRESRVFAARAGGEVISLNGRRRVSRPTEIVLWRG